MNLGTITAILAAVDAISPVVSKLQGNVNSGMGKIKAAISGAFAIGSISSAIHKFTEFAGTMTDLSAKTGIGTGALQALQLAFQASGVGIDTVTNAIGEMGRRLVSGDSGAVHGIEQLGLKTRDLLQMTPDEAFKRVADAVAGIENPMERATAAQEIFGKQGKELLAGLDGKLAETTASYARLGLVISDEVIAAGDDFGDTMTVLESTGMAFIANVVGPLLPGLTSLAQMFGSLAQSAIPALQGALNSVIVAGMETQRWLYDFLASVADAGAKVPLLGKALGATTENAAAFREQARQMKDAIAAFNIEAPKTEPIVKKVADIVGVYGENAKTSAGHTFNLGDYLQKVRWQDAASRADALTASLDDLNGSLTLEIGYLGDAAAAADTLHFASTDIGNTTDLVGRGWVPYQQGVEDSADAINGVLAEALDRTRAKLLTWRDVGKNLSNALMGALQGGGDVGKALGGSAGQMLGTKLGTSIGDWAGKNIGGALGSAIGGAAGSVLPVVGTLLGSVAGSAIGKIFGGGQGKAANDLRDQIIAQAGGFDALAKKAVEAGTSIDALLKARDTKGVQAAADALDKALNGRANQIALAKQAMEEFGISMDQAGQAFKQAEMDETARSITEKLEAMMSVGVSTDAIIAGAGDEIGAFIQRAIEMGTTVPKEWEPIVQKMIAAGTLIDANGDKFTDMSQVPFAETLNDKIGAVMDKLSAFIDRILDVPDALARIPRDVDVNFNGHYNTDGEAPGFASGSNGIRDFGRGTMAVLHGRERVQTEAQMRAEQRGGGASVTVAVDARGALVGDYASQRQLAKLISDAVVTQVAMRQRVSYAGGV